MPGTPYSRDHLLGIIDWAIEGGDPDFALRTARNVSPPIELDRALRLTVALAGRPHPRCEAAARRFVSRFAEEAQGASPRNIAQVADALAILSIISNATSRERQEQSAGCSASPPSFAATDPHSQIRGS